MSYPVLSGFASSGRFPLRAARRAVQFLLVASAAAAPVSLRAQLADAPQASPRPVAARERGPLTLVELLERVGAQHPLVAAAQARARAARGARSSAGAVGNPMLDLQVQSAPMPGQGAPMLERETMLTATLPLASLYQRRPRVRRADAEARAARADVATVQQQVALDASRAFYRATLAQVGVDAARDVAAWLDSLVLYNQARVKEGVAAEADLIRSEVERDRAAAAATLQEAELARARAELAPFLGEPDATLASAAALVVVVANEPLVVPQAFSLAMARLQRDSIASRSATIARTIAERPRVVAARERLAAAGAGVAVERTMILRELGATIGAMQSGGATSLIAGLSLPLPLLDQNRGEIARATAERDAAKFELAAAERSASADLSGAYEAARLLTSRVVTLAAAESDGVPLFLARADEARRIALGAYREGAVPLFTVIDAVRTWGEARVAFHEAVVAQHESVLTLLAAEGVELTTALSSMPKGARR